MVEAFIEKTRPILISQVPTPDDATEVTVSNYVSYAIAIFAGVYLN